MKNCYFFKGTEDGVWVQSNRKHVDGFSGIFIPNTQAKITTKEDGTIHSIKHTTTGHIYYPSPDCPEIQ